MIRFVRSDSSHQNFIRLVQKLDDDLAQRDGEEHGYYAQFNKITMLQHVVVAYLDEQAVGCGAIKPFDPEIMEVKRMYTAPESRGKGIAGQILSELETWAAELGYSRCVLETGKRQPEAIGLYQKWGYHIIPNYGQYVGVENSVCFEKWIIEPSSSFSSQRNTHPYDLSANHADQEDP